METHIGKRQWTISVMTLMVVAIMLVLWNRSFTTTKEAAFQEFSRRQSVLVENTANAIRVFFDEIAWHLKMTAAEDPAGNLDEERARADLQRRFERLSYLGVNDMGVLDADGILRYNVKAPAIEGRDFSYRRYFRTARQRPEAGLVINELIEFKGADVGKKGVIFAVPVVRTDGEGGERERRFGGVIVCTLKVDTLVRRFIAPLRLSDRGFVMLVDDELTILWSPDPAMTGHKLAGVREGTGGSAPLASAMSRDGSGMGEYIFWSYDDRDRIFTDDTEPYLFAYTTVRIGKGWWSIVSSTPTEEVKALLGGYYADQMMLLGVILTVVLAGSSYLLHLSSNQRRLLEREVDSRTRDLKESHERLLTILDGLEAAVYVSDIETHRILFANRYIRDIYGEVVGRLCWRTFHEEHNGPCSHCSNERILAPDGTPRGVHKWEYRSSTDGRWYAVYDRAIKWMDGRMVRLEIAVDITERKTLEEEKLRANRLAAVGRLAAGVAHEINNPLANASLNVQMLKDMLSAAGGSRDVMRKLEGVEKNVDRAAHIASELLDFSRSQRRETVKIDINKVVEDALMAVDYQMEGVEVKRRLALLPPVKGSPERLEQVFVNLLKNSIEAMPDGGEIDVTTRRDGAFVVVEIRDSGVGIGDDDLPRVFEPFFTTKEAGEGLGFGLAISYGIVAEHGGSIAIESGPGSGTTAVVRLPVHETEQEV
ncbi:MAG TPA: PAS domain-containing protein [Deltaproteobacteria bacterium]|nr:PAS domain-containing protein [Deltaproteobacteria bacterium]